MELTPTSGERSTQMTHEHMGFGLGSLNPLGAIPFWVAVFWTVRFFIRGGFKNGHFSRGRYAKWRR